MVRLRTEIVYLTENKLDFFFLKKLFLCLKLPRALNGFDSQRSRGCSPPRTLARVRNTAGQPGCKHTLWPRVCDSCHIILRLLFPIQAGGAKASAYSGESWKTHGIFQDLHSRIVVVLSVLHLVCDQTLEHILHERFWTERQIIAAIFHLAVFCVTMHRISDINVWL